MALPPLATPPPELRYRHHIEVRRSLRDLVKSRELVIALAERDIRTRYKQAILGVGWAVVTPFIMMVIFTVFVRRVADIDTNGVPYPLFSYVALLPWSFFSSSVSSGGWAFVSNSQLLNKVYCPREAFPISSMLGAAFDMLVSTGILGILFVVFGFMPKATAVWVPVLLLVQLLFTAGITFAISALLVYVRDIKQVVPLMLQLGLFATPVAWGLEVIPKSWQATYAVVNPLGPVMDGYRRSVLFGQSPQLDLLGLAGVGATIVFLAGYMLMKRLEVGFADVA